MSSAEMFHPVLVLYVISTLCVMTSAVVPKLSLEVTHDLTFTCTMAGFDRKMSRLLSLQITAQPFCGLFSSPVLAIVDDEGARTPRSSRGSFRLRHVTGMLQSRRQRDSWLKLTIFNFKGTRGYTGFTCQIDYLEHPTDSQQSSWQKFLYFGLSLGAESVVPKVQHKGFSVSTSRGLHAVCEYEGGISQSALVKEDGTVLASSSDCILPPAMCTRRGVFETYLPELICGKIHCSVGTTWGGFLTSPSQALPSYDCPLKHFTVGIIVSVLVAAIIVSVVGFVILRLRKTKRACFKSTAGKDNSNKEAGEPLGGDLATKGETKDVDVRKSAEEQSLSGSDTVSMVSSVGGLGLDVRPQTASV